ncbi:MAG TPA: hypothetical protein PK957_03390 [Candidatus Dojkabacteria bacterium]|nr:hypothetical protein [Candidatus Dojkabacteria bacterium]
MIFGVIGFLLFVQNFNSYNNKETWIEKEIPLNYGFNVDYVEKGKNELEIIVQGDQTIPSEYTDYVYCALGKYAPQMRLLWGVADDEVTPIKLKLFGDTDLYKQDTNIKQDKLFLHGMVYGKDDMRLYIDISSNRVRYIDIEYILLHEYTHIMQRYRFGSYAFSIPTWYIEGLAEYIAYEEGELIYGNEIYLITPDKSHLKEGLTLKEVDEWFYDVDSEVIEDAYSTYYYFVEFLINRYGFDKVLAVGDLSQTYKLNGQKYSFTEASQEILHEDIEVLFAEFLIANQY